MMVPLQPDRAMVLMRRGLRLEYTTLGWNLIRCFIVIASAYAARSVALGPASHLARGRERSRPTPTAARTIPPYPVWRLCSGAST